MRCLLPLVLFAASSLVLSAADPTAPAAAAPVTLRVLTYNIQHGEGLDKKINLERLAKFITDNKVDLVALQEVDRGVARTARRDEPAELARLTGLTGYFENNFHFQGGEYGNAILTRFPIKRATNTHYRMLRPNEQRGVLQLVLEIHGREVLFMNTHIDFRPDDAERLLNVTELKAMVAGAGAMPVILCGDFNAEPDSRTIANVKEFLTDSWEVAGHGPGLSYSSDHPKKRIDYIWVSRATLEPLKIEVLQSDASDHFPVLAELRLK